MVRTISRRLPLLALAALLGAVGIGPRRETGTDERSPAPSPSPSPAPAPSVPAPRARTGISPRAADPVRRGEGRRRSMRSAPSSGSVAPAPAPRTFSPAAVGPVRIQRREGIENVPRRHYWHGTGARRYSHFYDGRVHWYGYPRGAGFFWMRPYGGYWWWWDVRFSRWAYWNDGFWWWPGPGGVQFVYVDGGYYPYDSIRSAEYAAPAPSGDAGPWTSPDGRRLVEISGPDSQAVLYDRSTQPPAYLAYLGAGVRKVRFSSPASGAPPTILVERSEGTSAVFDLDGRRVDAAKPAAVKSPPPPAEPPPPPSEEEERTDAPPEDLPPPPSP